MERSSRYQGCLLGGAVGDALGAPVEFLSTTVLHSRYGPGGIRDFAPAYGRIGAITDDTQMTLFTAEGLVRAYVRWEAKGICHPLSVVHLAYLRWLKTQGQSPTKTQIQIGMDGWLIGLRALWSNRAPGNTCLSALQQLEQIGQAAKNDSKGCGGVMRAAPAGLAGYAKGAFQMGSDTAALTHGHPSGYLSAGVLAQIIAEIVGGTALPEAIQAAKRTLVTHSQHGEVLTAIGKAESFATTGSTKAVAEGKLGAGWIAEEALSIALYCSLIAPNFEEAVIMAVNHGGDSDSTGAIAGNMCGALYGIESIPSRWLDPLELRDEISTVADDLLAVHENRVEPLEGRYPPS